LGLLCTFGSWFFLWQGRMQAELEVARSGLLEEVRAHAQKLDENGASRVARITAWISQTLGAYAGDFVAPELSGMGALGARLSKPVVYLRGALSELEGERGLYAAAEGSFPDALPLCLLDPPQEHDERTLRRRAAQIYAGGEHSRAISHMERLHDLLVGLPFLLPAWEVRVLLAKDLRGIEELAQRLRAAPLDAAARASHAPLLLLVLDEPKDGAGPTELDGSSPHFVRVHLIDLDEERVLLRLRRHVDPGWISPDVRAEYASGITSCELALLVQKALTPEPSHASTEPLDR
jgi:hypothetical protein